MSAPAPSIASTSIGTTDPRQHDVEELEATFHQDLKLIGALVWTSYNDKLIYVPIEGFPGTPSLDEMVKFDLYAAKLTNVQRNIIFTLTFDDTGDEYDAKLFARIEEGMYCPGLVSP